MSLIRPEIRARLWRGRELWVGLGLAALFLRGAMLSFGVTRWVAAALALAAIGFAVAGWRRMRLRPETEGLGVVETDEGRITYWGPLDGGTVDLDALAELAIDHRSVPPAWVLVSAEGRALHIPVTAGGQDALLDALETLPGLSDRQLLAARAKPEGRHRLWSRSRVS